VQLHPALQAALRAQLARRARALAAGAEPVGWKVGATIAEIGALVDGTLRASAPVDVDVAAALARVDALLGAAGLWRAPGDRVLTGSLTHVPVAPGQELAAEIDGLGRVTVTLAG
jgi:2-keto-4-pentenoate hydratase